MEYYLRKAELDGDVLGEGKNPSIPRSWDEVQLPDKWS